MFMLDASILLFQDYATVFSYGDGWSTDGAADDHNSLVYRFGHQRFELKIFSASKCLFPCRVTIGFEVVG